MQIEIVDEVSGIVTRLKVENLAVTAKEVHWICSPRSKLQVLEQYMSQSGLRPRNGGCLRLLEVDHVNFVLLICSITIRRPLSGGLWIMKKFCP